MPSDPNPNPFPDEDSIMLCIPGYLIIPRVCVHQPPVHIHHVDGCSFLYVHVDLRGGAIILEEGESP